MCLYVDGAPVIMKVAYNLAATLRRPTWGGYEEGRSWDSRRVYEKLVSEAGTDARELACLSGPLHATPAVHQDGGRWMPD